MKRSAAVAGALVLALTVAGPAMGQNVHFKGGRNAGPTFTDNGLTLSASGALAGLGNQDVLITLEAIGNPTATCTNPSGKNQPPGQNPAPVTVTGSEAIPAAEVKNGNVTFFVTTEPPESPIPGAPDCPNRRWTETITDMAFTSAVLTVEQPAGTVVLTANCTFASPTRNGSVPRNQVTCTTS
ncbi:MAG: hypothetical protein M3245_05420 [Actinomycetota bacterium]|nr:hypothetical protein [Actinomycetota bacterium]